MFKRQLTIISTCVILGLSTAGCITPGQAIDLYRWDQRLDGRDAPCNPCGGHISTWKDGKEYWWNSQKNVWELAPRGKK